MSDKTTENLLEAVIEKKPVDFREIFEELMVPKLKAVVGEHSQVVAESLFLNDDDESGEQLDEISVKKSVQALDKAHWFKTAAQDAEHSTPKFDPEAAKHWRKQKNKRQRQADKFTKYALNKLTKEEEDEQLAEAGYDKDAVDKQIKKDRVGKGESKKIHALLKGRQRGDGDTADWKEKEEQKRFERNRRHD